MTPGAGGSSLRRPCCSAREISVAFQGVGHVRAEPAQEGDLCLVERRVVLAAEEHERPLRHVVGGVGRGHAHDDTEVLVRVLREPLPEAARDVKHLARLPLAEHLVEGEGHVHDLPAGAGRVHRRGQARVRLVPQPLRRLGFVRVVRRRQHARVHAVRARALHEREDVGRHELRHAMADGLGEALRHDARRAHRLADLARELHEVALARLLQLGDGHGELDGEEVGHGVQERHVAQLHEVRAHVAHHDDGHDTVVREDGRAHERGADLGEARAHVRADVRIQVHHDRPDAVLGRRDDLQAHGAARPGHERGDTRPGRHEGLVNAERLIALRVAPQPKATRLREVEEHGARVEDGLQVARHAGGELLEAALGQRGRGDDGEYAAQALVRATQLVEQALLLAAVLVDVVHVLGDEQEAARAADAAAARQRRDERAVHELGHDEVVFARNVEGQLAGARAREVAVVEEVLHVRAHECLGPHAEEALGAGVGRDDDATVVERDDRLVRHGEQDVDEVLPCKVVLLARLPHVPSPSPSGRRYEKGTPFGVPLHSMVSEAGLEPARPQMGH